MQSLITAYALPQNQMRLSLMGAVVAIRAWSALAALGHRFPTHYPAPAERFAAILGQFRDMCADEYTYYYYGTIAVAHDQRMEAAERVFKGLEYTPAITSERLISTAMAMLIEVQSAAAPPPVGNDIGFMLDRATPAVRAEAEATARRVFTADAVQYGQAATAVGRQTTAIVDGYWTLMQSFAPDTPIEKPTGVH